MDFALRCNYVKCRTKLTDRAVVTTCSHIFCPACAGGLGLGRASGNQRICPACEASLTNPDDVVETKLCPTEDYKTSVLSGLSPGIIMECCGRGLAFYSYQTTQEIIYQEYLEKTMKEKYNTLSSQMDQIIHDANSEITNLRNKISAQEVEFNNLLKKNTEAVSAFKDKSSSHARVQKMYDDLKKQLLHSNIQMAAADAAEYTLQETSRYQDGAASLKNGHLHNKIIHRDLSSMDRLPSASRITSQGGGNSKNSTTTSTPMTRSRLPLHITNETRRSAGSDTFRIWPRENRFNIDQTFNSDTNGIPGVHRYGISADVRSRQGVQQNQPGW